jgi:antitoxin YefM
MLAELVHCVFLRPLASPPGPGDLHRGARGGALCRHRKLVRYMVRVEEVTEVALTASEARKNLFPLIEQVNNDRQPVEITSKRGDAVLISRADFDALNETAFLLRVPANAERLLESLAQAREQKLEEHELA